LTKLVESLPVVEGVAPVFGCLRAYHNSGCEQATSHSVPKWWIESVGAVGNGAPVFGIGCQGGT
jgi:hypothetical protein